MVFKYIFWAVKMTFITIVKCSMFVSRHVMLPKDIAKRVPKTHLMSETEWRNLGVQQSQGWVHYMIHQPGMCVFARMSKTRPNMCHLYCCHCWCSCLWLLFIIEPHILLFRRPLPQSKWLHNHKLKEFWKLDTIWRCLRDAGCTPDQTVSVSFVLLHMYWLFFELDYHHCAWSLP